MKIIKQNDSDGGLIFKQNTGGKAMKQNYNFRRGYVTRNTYRPTLTLTKQLLRTQPYSIMFFMKIFDKGMSNYTATDGAYTSTNNIAMYHRIINNQANPINIVYNINTTIAQVGGGFQLLFYGTDGVSISKYLNIKTGDVVTVNALPNNDTETYRFLMSEMHFMDGVRGGFAIFNRLLSDKEVLYRRNNLLGNDFLNIDGLTNYYPMDMAKILTQNSVQVVGCEDEIGGNHMVFGNLPAGTLEQQRDFLNNSFFQPFF